MSGQQRLSFDTSGVNAFKYLSELDCAALLAGIRTGYFTRLTFPSVEEPIAASDAAMRHKLFGILNRLRLNGECLQAHNWLATRFIQNYEKQGNSMWDSLDIRFSACEVAIARSDISDDLSAEQRNFAAETEDNFTKTFADLRPKTEQLFSEGTARPSSADELLLRLNGYGGAFWNFGAGLYERAAGRHPTEEQVRAFAADCPPFLALLLSLVHAEFEWAIKENQVKEDKRVGRIDLFSSIYLPYCDIYITNDDEQRRCLTEIAAAANLPVEVTSLAEFSNRLMPLAHLAISGA